MDFIRRNPVMSLVLAVVILIILVVLFLAVTGSLFSSPEVVDNDALAPGGTIEIDTDANFLTNAPNEGAIPEGEGEGDPTVIPAAQEEATALAEEPEPTTSG